MRIGLFHDYLTQRGGAERVALTLAEELGPSFFYTALYEPAQTFAEFQDMSVSTSALQNVPAFRRDPRAAIPLLPKAFGRLDAAAHSIDVALCSSSGWAHSAKVDCPRVIYFHTPARWLYETESFCKGASATTRAMSRIVRRPLTLWDQRQLRDSDVLVANSQNVRQRIGRVYERDAIVISPPLSLDVAGKREEVHGLGQDYVLMVARERGYKNVQAGVAACRSAGQRMVVVTPDGPRHENGVFYTGTLTDGQLRTVYAEARVLLALSTEDFGLTPIEANAFGTPVLALRQGGYLDTVDETVNGAFLPTDRVVDTADALLRFDPEDFGRDILVKHAATYGRTEFAAHIRALASAAVASRT